MFPAYRAAQRSFIFFGIFITSCLFFIVPMILTMVMDAFWAMTKKLVKKDRKKERKKLIEAFNFLGEKRERERQRQRDREREIDR